MDRISLFLMHWNTSKMVGEYFTTVGLKTVWETEWETALFSVHKEQEKLNERKEKQRNGMAWLTVGRTGLPMNWNHCPSQKASHFVKKNGVGKVNGSALLLAGASRCAVHYQKWKFNTFHFGWVSDWKGNQGIGCFSTMLTLYEIRSSLQCIHVLLSWKPQLNVFPFKFSEPVFVYS